MPDYVEQWLRDSIASDPNTDIMADVFGQLSLARVNDLISDNPILKLLGVQMNQKDVPPVPQEVLDWYQKSLDGSGREGYEIAEFLLKNS